MPNIHLRTLNTLPSTKLSWLELNDHFVATVGPNAGSGHPMGPLLVLADATFAPSSRFALHPHRDIEILSIVIAGELSHHGDQANGATLKAREAQLISARNGIVHAEGNDTAASTHMLQIWFTPNARGGEPVYFQRKIPKGGGRQLVAGDQGMPLRANAQVWWLDLEPGHEERVTLPKGHAGYLLAMNASLMLNEGAKLATGEGAELRSGELTVRPETTPAAALWIDVEL